MRRTLADELARAENRLAAAQGKVSDLSEVDIDKEALLEEAKTADGKRLKEILETIQKAQAKASRIEKRSRREVEIAAAALDRLNDQAKLEEDYLRGLEVSDRVAEMLYVKAREYANAYEDGYSSACGAIEMIYDGLVDLVRASYTDGYNTASKLVD